MRVFHGRLARLVITGLAVCACTARAGAQTQFEVIHRFSEVDPPYAPGAGLVQGTDGQFYGTTSFGGPGGHGTVFKVTPGGAVTVLHVFDGTDGDRPFARLVQASDGKFYGTAMTIFRVQP